MALVHCSPAVFRLLIPRLQNIIHQVDSEGGTDYQEWLELTRPVRSRKYTEFVCQSATGSLTVS